MLSPFLNSQIPSYSIWPLVKYLRPTRGRKPRIYCLILVFSLLSQVHLIIPNYIVLVLVGVIGLFVLRSMKMNEVFQMLSGILLVFILYCSILFLLDIEAIPELVKVSIIPRLVFFDIRGESFYKMAIIFAVSIFTVLSYGKYTLKKSIQTQKKIDILYWFMMASLFMLFLFSEINANQVLLLFIPLAILLNTNFLNIKSILVQEVIHVILLALLIALNFGVI